MDRTFKLNFFKAGAVAAVLAVSALLSPVQAQGLFFKEHKSKPLPKELMALRAAYMMADKTISPETIEQELNAELDKALNEKNGQGHTSTLKKKELEEARIAEFKSNPKYIPSSDSKVDVRSFEIFKRSNQAAQEKVVQDLKIPADQVVKGFKSSHHLSKEDVPYGGNMFSDNLGGIARRWNNKDFFGDELFDYKTFHEKALGRVNHAAAQAMKLFKAQKPAEYNKFKANCRKERGMNTKHKKIECFKKVFKDWTDQTAKEIVIEDLKELSDKQLHGLSPTEKYDLANGYFDFRTTLFEKYYKGKRRKPSTQSAPWLSSFLFHLYWEGRCNADRACNLCNRHNEPIHQLTVDVEEIGKQIVFEPLDIKALLMSTYFYVEKFGMMGERTEKGTHQRPPNMAAFDALIRGAFTQHDFPFVIDNRPGPTVNNVTVVGYDRKVKNIRPLKPKEKWKLQSRLEEAEEYAQIIKKNASKNIRNNIPKNFGDGVHEESFQNELEQYKKLITATKVMSVKTKLTVLADVPVTDANGPTKADIAHDGKYTTQEAIEYDLYLNDDNEVVEGMFKSGNLDFLWFADGKGTEELEEDGNKFIKYETMKDLAIKASKKEQNVDPGVFPGRKPEKK